MQQRDNTDHPRHPLASPTAEPPHLNPKQREESVLCGEEPREEPREESVVCGEEPQGGAQGGERGVWGVTVIGRPGRRGPGRLRGR